MQQSNKQANNNPQFEENIKIITAIKDNLINIRSCVNTDDNTELTFLDKYINDKEIIGLGEDTHGTKEFQNMRTRIISYLISNLGFRTIVLEESYSHCLKLNYYILGGEGTAEEAVREGLFFPWVFKTEETIALVKCIREYNDTVNIDNKVRFYGMDLQGSEKAIEVLQFYIKKVDINNYNKIKTDLDFISHKNNKPNFIGLKEKLSNIDELFIRNRTNYIKNSSEIEYSEIYHCIETYRKWIDFSMDKTFNMRDKCMFENAKWIIENAKKYNNGKVIIIGHNDHISKGISPNTADFRQVGYWIDNEYKEKYYNIGFEFSRGLFYSKDINDSYKLKKFQVDKSIKHDLAGRLFEATNNAMFYLDLKTTAQNNHSFQDFILSINRYYSIGAVYDEEKDDFGIDHIILMNMYDAVLYIKDSSVTTILSTEKK